jgi:hypothetical protein
MCQIITISRNERKTIWLQKTVATIEHGTGSIMKDIGQTGLHLIAAP